MIQYCLVLFTSLWHHWFFTNHDQHVIGGYVSANITNALDSTPWSLRCSIVFCGLVLFVFFLLYALSCQFLCDLLALNVLMIYLLFCNPLEIEYYSCSQFPRVIYSWLRDDCTNRQYRPNYVNVSLIQSAHLIDKNTLSIISYNKIFILAIRLLVQNDINSPVTIISILGLK